MIEYRINLLRDRVPGIARRRRRYWLMVGYVALAGIALVLVLKMSVTQWLEARELRRRTELMETQFRSTRNEADGIQPFVEFQHKQLEGHQRALQALDQFYASDVRLAPVLMALVKHLPRSAIIRSFSVQGDAGTIQVEILFVGLQAARGKDPAELLALWNADALIASQLGEISFQGSNVDGVATQNDIIWRFTATLKKGADA